ALGALRGAAFGAAAGGLNAAVDAVVLLRVFVPRFSAAGRRANEHLGHVRRRVRVSGVAGRLRTKRLAVVLFKVGGVGRQVPVDELVDVIALDERQDVGGPAERAPRQAREVRVRPLPGERRRRLAGGDAVARHEGLERVVIVVGGDGQLVQVVAARGRRGGGPHLLHGGYEQADEDGDDGDHHQQLDQRETGGAIPLELHESTSSTREKGGKRRRDSPAGEHILGGPRWLTVGDLFGEAPDPSRGLPMRVT